MKRNSSLSINDYTKRNQYVFNIDEERKITISSNFENGNIEFVKQYILSAMSDVEGTSSKKSWFYFKMKSQKYIKVRIIIENVDIYQNIFQYTYIRFSKGPTANLGLGKETIHIGRKFMTLSSPDQLALVIDHTFKNQQQVYICLTIPFTYTDCQNYLTSLQDKLHPNIYYQNKIITKTNKNNNVRLLTITELPKNTYTMASIQDKKPVIIITSRVHPGQVSSSYCLMGILQFLLSYNNLQAYILRRLFVFKIIPMVNPDGVVEGNYRMDPQGYNLNRFYQDPSAQKHGVIFEIVKIIKNIGMKQKIQYYFDLHSHSAIKQSFIYGNALDDIVQQTYSQFFCKILEQNFSKFRYYLSNFHQKQMKHKDKGQTHSKEGCGRVVIYKLFNVVQSYTVQSSIFPAAYVPFIQKQPKLTEKNLQFKIFTSLNHEQFGYQSIVSNLNKNQNIIIKENKKLGASILISILDVVQKNPYTRFTSQFYEFNYKEMANKLFQNQQRFKLKDIKAYNKCKNIHNYIKRQFQDKINKQWGNSGVYKQMNTYNWPLQFKKIVYQDFSFPSTKQIKNSHKKFTISSFSKQHKKIQHQKNISYLQIQTNSQQQNKKRSLSPQHRQNNSVFPQIKYSVQLKNKESYQNKIFPVKQINFGEAMEKDFGIKKIFRDGSKSILTQGQQQRTINKKQTNSVNRLIVNKLIEKDKAKNTRLTHLCDYQRIILQSRKRITTQCTDAIVIRGQLSSKNAHLLSQQIQQNSSRGFQHKKNEIIKKKLLLNNKLSQITKKGDKSKLKFPQVNRLNFLISNTKKTKTQPQFQDKDLQSFNKQ